MLSSNAIESMLPAAASHKVARRQDRTRERLLAESAGLFLTHGFAAVSVEQIVAAAGIARSSFYRFFANREEVLASIIRPVFEHGVTTMRDVARRPARQVIAGVLDMYLAQWRTGSPALRLATRMGGTYFRLFEDVHHEFRASLTGLMRRVEPTGLLLNGSGEASARLIARTAVPVLEVYATSPRIDSQFHQTMTGLLVRPEVQS